MACLRILRPPAIFAGTESPQIVKCIDPRAVTILPEQLNGIISDSANFHQRRIRTVNEPARPSVPLTHRAGTVAAQISLVILAHVAVVPGNPYDGT